MNTIQTNRGRMSAAEIIDDLTYISYAANRDAAQHITPEQWEKVYGPSVAQMEARYLADTTKVAA